MSGEAPIAGEPLADAVDLNAAAASAIETLMDGWEAAWGGRDPNGFRVLCAHDVHYVDPLTPQPLRGPLELGEHAARLWRAFPDMRLERAGPRLSGGRVAVIPCRLAGTHTGEVDGLPPTGRVVELHTLFYCELEAYRPRMLRVRAFFDAYGAAVDVGVLPKPGSVSDRAMLMLRGYGLRGLRRSWG